IQRRPHDVKLRHEAGVIFLRNAFEEDGERWLITALQEDFTYSPSHLELAKHYRRKGNTERAEFHEAAARHFESAGPRGESEAVREAHEPRHKCQQAADHDHSRDGGGRATP